MTEMRPPSRRCPACGEDLRRIHRKFWEKAFWVAVMRCRGCGKKVRLTAGDLGYGWGTWARCPECGTAHIELARNTVPLPRMHHHWSNHVKRLLGGKLYHCRYCQIRFYDLRNPSRSDPRA